jgi:hypothetical protein
LKEGIREFMGQAVPSEGSPSASFVVTDFGEGIKNKIKIRIKRGIRHLTLTSLSPVEAEREVCGRVHKQRAAFAANDWIEVVHQLPPVLAPCEDTQPTGSTVGGDVTRSASFSSRKDFKP